MSGQQQLVALGGATLMGLYAATSEEGKALRWGLANPDDLTAKSSNLARWTAAHDAAKHLGLMLLGVAAGTLIAGVNRYAGNLMVAITAALIVLFIINKDGAPAPRKTGPSYGPNASNPGTQR